MAFIGRTGSAPSGATAAGSTAQSGRLLDPKSWVAEHGDCLYRYEKFSERGFWYHDSGPLEWKPEAVEQITQAEFWQTFRVCLGRLPERIAAAFSLREMDELGTEELCRILAISPSNLW